MATGDLEMQMNLKKINDENGLCHVQWCMTVMNTGLTQDLHKQLHATPSIIQVLKYKNKRNPKTHPQWQLTMTDMHRMYYLLALID